VKEMIGNYNHADQYVKLKGRQINVGEGMADGKESYYPIVVTYFIGNEDEHYILCSKYLIAKVDGR
jgi:hypothetical protein